MSKNRIIQSALSLISKKEIWNVSASEIASQAETSKANVFYHFNSLENLYSRMFDDFQAEIKDEIWNELNDNWNTERKLEHLFMKRGRWALNNSEKMRFLIMWYSINGLLSKSIEDKNLWRIISKGIQSKTLIRYGTTHISCLFYSHSNSIAITLIDQPHYIKKKITMLRKSFEAFFETVKQPEKEKKFNQNSNIS